MSVPTRPVSHAAIASVWGQAVHDWTFTPLGFEVHGSGVSCGTSMTKLDISAADDDPGGWLVAASDAVVAPTDADGLYLVVARLQTVSGAAGEYTRAKLIVNSSDLSMTVAVNAGGTNVGFTITDIVAVTAGDSFSVYAQRVGSTSPTVSVASLQMVRIGDSYGS